MLNFLQLLFLLLLSLFLDVEEKLLDDPKNLNSRSCVREFKKLNCGKNLHKRDMVNISYQCNFSKLSHALFICTDFTSLFVIRLYFPRVDSFHWTLFCINSLFETVNFFDSRSSVPQNQVNKLTSNLVCFLILFVLLFTL